MPRGVKGSSKLDGVVKRMTKGVENQEIDQSHRENLQWAIAAAGHFLRTNQEPLTCPNNAAYFLYRQAREQPKEFLTKVTQVETKVDRSGEGVKRAVQKSIEEINKLLEALTEPEDENIVSTSCSKGKDGQSQMA